ncbi:Protein DETOXIFICATION 45, chloroplastic [Linum perenne]
MSTTRQFGGGTLSSVVSGRTKLTTSSSSWACHSQTAVGFGWRDGSTRNYLSAEYRDQLSPLVTCRRKRDSEVVYNQSASGYGVESAADAEESLELVEGDVVNGSAHEKLDSVGVPVEKKPNFKPLVGSVELASAGVATMIFNNISKLFNIPLFSVATSFVAEDIAKNAVIDSTAAEEGHTNGALVDKVVKRKQLASVSTALLLATGIGILEATMLSFGCGPFLNLMGVTQGTQMRIPAEKFLSIKALGAPALVLSLTLQGIFRGFKDPSTPVLCLVNCFGFFQFVCASQPLNALAYIFDGLHYGVSDFRYAACSMMMVGAISSLFLLYVPGILGLPGVWSGLALFMALRTGAGIARVPAHVLAKLVVVPYMQGANARPLVVLPSIFLEIPVPPSSIFLHFLDLWKLKPPVEKLHQPPTPHL